MSAVFGLLGLASRAGQITLGADLAIREIRGGRAGAVLLDESASEGTRKKILDACAYRGVPAYILSEDALSRACGKEGRMAAAVKQGKLCERIRQLLDAEQGQARA